MESVHGHRTSRLPGRQSGSLSALTPRGGSGKLDPADRVLASGCGNRPSGHLWAVVRRAR